MTTFGENDNAVIQSRTMKGSANSKNVPAIKLFMSKNAGQTNSNMIQIAFRKVR